ncbi:MAG TPA: DNRLRE domain-containing protein [Pyrinomonadaceae bacterium]
MTAKKNHSCLSIKAARFCSGLICLLVIVSAGTNITFAQQATLTDDASTESSKPSKNFGNEESVKVSPNEKGFVKFKLTPILPTGTTGNRVGKATFKIFVNEVITAGSFEAYRVAGSWTESVITDGTAPLLGNLEGSIVVSPENRGQWITVDVTQLVKDWLDAVLPNNGIALVAQPGGAQISFDSKESDATSHEARLEIILNHATTADTATNFSGSLSGDVTGTQNATVVSSVGGQTAALVASGSAAANAATEANTPNTIVKRDAAGSFSAETVNVNTQYSIGAKRVLSISGANNLFAGAGAGGNNTIGNDNTFVGAFAGNNNTSGNNNVLVGTGTGFFSTTAINNSFFGVGAGTNNTTGSDNSFFGRGAGVNNTLGARNVFIGNSAGLSNTFENLNSFIGFSANGLIGISNATAIGANAAVTRSNSLVLGSISGVNGAIQTTSVGIGTTAPTQRLDVVGNVRVSGEGNGVIFPDLTKMTSAGASLGANSFNGNQSITGNLSVTGLATLGNVVINSSLTVDTNTLRVSSLTNRVGIGTTNPAAKLDVVGTVNSSTQYNIGNTRVLSVEGTNNIFVGASAGTANGTGTGNSFLGKLAGNSNTTGFSNAFVGYQAGRLNTTGDLNTFLGAGAGEGNTTAGNNTFVGFNAGSDNDGTGNSFLGARAGEINSTGNGNSFFGRNAGQFNRAGFNNSFFGDGAGRNTDSGSNNTFIGDSAGDNNIHGSDNTVIGAGANVGGSGLSHATAIGAGVVVSHSNTVVIGRGNDRIEIPGVLEPLRLGLLRIGDGLQLCQSNGSSGTFVNELVVCGLIDERSSLRYKTAVRPFTGGLDMVRRLRPITFTWRDRPKRDLGLAAEDVAKVEPLLVKYNAKGEVEGVKYAQLSAVLIDAVQQQQVQLVEQRRLIEQQQIQIEQQRSQTRRLLRLVCSTHKLSKLCR